MPNVTIKQDSAIFRSTHLGKSPTSAPITLQVNIVFLRHCVLLTCCFGRVGIAPAYNSHVQYFDGEDRRDKYDEFYEQLVRVKDIAALPFADNAQKLLVKYIREDLGQPRAANWYPNSAKGKPVAALGVVAAMDIYESFHLVQRNATWAGRDDRMHFSKFAADQASDDTDPPAQIPAMCSCKW